MIIKIKSSKEIVKDYLKLSIHECEKNPTVFKNSIDLNDEFIGKVGEGEFWIQKIRPRFFRGPYRAFYGVFTQTEEGTVINGKFKLVKGFKKQKNISSVIAMIIVSMALFYLKVPLIKTLIILILFYLFYNILFYANIIFSIREEKVVKKFLNDLGSEIWS